MILSFYELFVYARIAHYSIFFKSCTGHMQSEDDYKNYWMIKQEVAPKIQKGKVWVLFTHAYTVWKGKWQMQSIYKDIYRQVIASENWT